MKNLKSTYDQIADEFDSTRRYPGKEFWLFKDYIKPGSFIIDLGCGNGRFLKFLEEAAKNWQTPKFHYLGIDTNEKLLNLARKQFAHFPGESFILGDQTAIPIADNTADNIFNIRAFHHIPSWNLRLQAILEMKRVLKPNGILTITVWNLWQKKYWKELFKAIIRAILTFGSYDFNDTFIPWGKNYKRYYHAFTPTELNKLLSHAGFEVMESYSVNQSQDLVIIAKKNTNDL